ncbi:MAG: SpoIID/LytB domain-containing protein [Planctomycetota bacterium]
MTPIARSLPGSTARHRSPRRSWSGVIALVGGLVAGACLTPTGSYRASSAAPVVEPWDDENRVPVLLTQAEGSLSLTLSTAEGDSVEVWRQGDGVASSEHRTRRSLRLDLPTGADAWRYRDREYPGELLVEPAAGGGLTVSALLDLEDYVEGVVASELVLWSAPDALLEAQAIAARSYAVANLDQRAQYGRAYLQDGVLDQAFRGRFQPDAASRSRKLDQRLRDAVRRTRGQVMLAEGRVLDTRFHASCAGRTADARDVFEHPPSESHTPVVCPPCRDSRLAIERARDAGVSAADEHADLQWTHTASPEALARMARAAGVGDGLLAFDRAEVDAGGRWLTVELTGPGGTRTVPFGELRESLGWNNVRSGVVTASWPSRGARIPNGLRLDGLGHGHGSGLCQRGADRLAEQGWSATRILRWYYADAELGTIGSAIR